MEKNNVHPTILIYLDNFEKEFLKKFSNGEVVHEENLKDYEIDIADKLVSKDILIRLEEKDKISFKKPTTFLDRSYL